MNEKKTMNTHLHILEAYTNLYRVWPDKQLAESQIKLIDVFLQYIINDKFHLNLFFDENWNLKSNIVSYGHDIECSWLLYEAAEALNNKVYIEKLKNIAINMAERVLQEGVAEDGGINNEFNISKNYLDTDKHWWPQTEGLVGFYIAYQLSGDKKYIDAVFKSWDFINRFVVDHKKGEWFGIVDNKGIPYPEDKLGPWKCPYHNTRACIELIKRIGN